MMTTDSSTTPLLTDTDAESQSHPIPSNETKRLQPVTPIPRSQIFILSYGILAEYICLSVISPFINEMIESVGVTNPGYWSGLVEGIFHFSQIFTVYYWGSLSDRIGRKPVLLAGLVSVATFNCIFGLSTSLWMMILSRFCVGLGNANVPVTKSSIAELTDETNQSRAFSFLSLSWSIGGILAPLIGGYLARPNEKYPRLFGSSSLFIRYPYLLPCLAAMVIAATACVLGYMFLEESLYGKRPGSRVLPREEYELLLVEQTNESADHEDATRPSPQVAQRPASLSIREVVADTYIRHILVAYLFLALITTTIDGVLALWLYAPLEKGGLGFTTSQIGSVMSSVGLLTTLVNFLIFPPLQRRLGTIPIYRFGMALQPIVVIMLPITGYIALKEQPEGSAIAAQSGFWTKAAIATLVIVKSAGGVAFSCNILLVGSSAPSKTSLGAVNGVAHMVASITRTIGPALATMAFALSTDARYHALGGQLVWVYMLIIAGCAIVASRRVQEGRNNTRDL